MGTSRRSNSGEKAWTASPRQGQFPYRSLRASALLCSCVIAALRDASATSSSFESVNHRLYIDQSCPLPLHRLAEVPSSLLQKASASSKDIFGFFCNTSAMAPVTCAAAWLVPLPHP